MRRVTTAHTYVPRAAGLETKKERKKKTKKNGEYWKKEKKIFRTEQNAQNELYLLFSQKSKDLSNRKSSWNAQEAHTREKYILLYKYIWDIKKIASIPCSYANVALSNCLFHTDPDVLLYPMEYYISKYIIYIYIYYDPPVELTEFFRFSQFFH